MTRHLKIISFSAVVAIIILSFLVLKTCTASSYRHLSLVELLEQYRAELDAPGLTVAKAAIKLKSATKAAKFVRDGIVFAPYPGRMQDPDTVLRTRTANGLDKAMLLGSLLEAQGYQVQYLDGGEPESAPVAKVAKSARPSKVLKEIARLIHFDLAGLDQERETLRSHTDKTRTHISASLKAASALVREKAADLDYATTTSNFWTERIIVQASKKGTKKRFDPVYKNVPLPKDEIESFTFPPLQIPLIEVALRDATGFQKPLLRWSGTMAGQNVALHFLPAIETAKALAGPPQPQRIRQWMPVLSVGSETIPGKPFSIDGRAPGLWLKPPALDPKTFALADPQSASMLALTRVGSGDGSTTSLSLHIQSQGGGAWVPAHFVITDNGQPVYPRLLNIEQSAKPVVVLSDVSPSMVDIGAMELSKEAIINFAAHLSPTTPLSLISFARQAREELPMAPLGDGTALAKAARSLEPREYTGIYVGLERAAEVPGLDNGVIVLMSDGEDNVGGDEQAILAALRARNIRVFALALGTGADATLLRRIAEASGGQFAKITTAKELKPFYDRLGSELTSNVVLEYDTPLAALLEDETAASALPTPADAGASESAENEAITAPEEAAEEGTAGPESLDTKAGTETETGAKAADEPEGIAHLVRVRLKGSGLEASGRYLAPAQPPHQGPPQLILHVEIPLEKAPIQTDRVIVELDSSAAPWALMGDYALMYDLGGFGKNRLTSAYISAWISALHARAGRQDRRQGPQRPSFDLVQTVNGFRFLSMLPEDLAVLPGAGPNLYLRRSVLSADESPPVRRRIFDVLGRAQRGYKPDESIYTGVAARMELAGAIAEGVMLGGTNGVDALLGHADSLQIIKPGEPRPGWLAPALRAVPLAKPKQPSLSDIRRTDRLLVSKEVPGWAWQVDVSWNHYIRVLYGRGNVLAKGASAEEIAAQFDKIDKIYQIYDTAVGNLPGPYASTGAMLSAIASMKRQENKVWCFATVMMGYVGEAVEDDDAALNRNAQATKAKAASLCKIEGNPDDAGAFVRNAVLGAARDGASSWRDNIIKEGVGGAAANAHSAWKIGGALANAAALYRSDPATISPVTPAFHRAMGEAVQTQ